MNRKKKKKRRGQLISYLFIMPSFLFLFAFLIFPMISSFYLSLTSYDFVYSTYPEFIGMKNYFNLLGDRHFVASFKNTIYYTILYFPIFFFFPLGIALLLREKIKGAAIFRTGILLPMVIPASLASVVFLWIFDNEWGILNFALRDLLKMPFLAKYWLMDSNFVIPSLVGVRIWKCAGFSLIIYLAGLQAISDRLYEAAKIDGANNFRTFVHITLPNLKGSFILAGLLGIMHSFKAFTEAFVMTYGGPGLSSEFLYLYFWKTSFGFFKMGYGAAIAYSTGLIILVPSILILILIRSEKK